MRTIFLVVAGFALAAVALAADVTGAWSGSFSIGDNGDSRTAYIVLKQAGASLTGTAGPDSSEQWPIEAGKIEGSKISFDVHAPDGAVYKTALVLEGDNLNGDLTAVMDGQTIKGKIKFSRVK